MRAHTPQSGGRISSIVSAALPRNPRTDDCSAAAMTLKPKRISFSTFFGDRDQAIRTQWRKHMAKIGRSGFNKILGAGYTVLNQDPLVGILTLKTDTGTIELAMIKPVAEALMGELIDFLQEGKGDDAPSFAVERSQ
nr:MAG TPA: hypothetical protein [Caudoviricetes sp.]